MTSRTTKALAIVLLTVALAATGCKAKGNAQNGAAPAASSAAPSPSTTGEAAASPSASATTVILNGEEAKDSGATPGTEATVVPDPADASGAESASEPPAENSAKDKLVDQLAEDTGIDIDDSTPAAVQWVTVKSPDQKLSMDVPSDWAYAAYANLAGGTTFGAIEGGFRDGEQGDQRALHGSRTGTTQDVFIARVIAEQSSCQPAPERPYEDPKFVGKGLVIVCPDHSTVFFVVDGKNEKSFYHGYFKFVTKDGVGLAAVDRAIKSFDVVA